MASPLFDIMIYAPSGRLWEPQALTRAENFLRQAGHRVHVDADAGQAFQRFSGDDEARLAAVHRVLYRLLHNEQVDIAMAARGGYGWTRLLDRIDYVALARDKKCWVGHSDFTAFQLAALAKAQRVTFAGPMACSDFGVEEVSAFTDEHCFDLLAANRHEIFCTLRGDRSLTATGTLWGGNLSMIAHLIGTSYFPYIDGGILFLEDVNEEPYRIERMLYQLHHSGVLACQQAVLLGHFVESKASEQVTGYTLDTAIDHMQRVSGVPFFRGLPFGHVRDKLTLPVGAPCELIIDDDGQSRIVCWDYRS